jgi:hypothetical protein
MAWQVIRSAWPLSQKQNGKSYHLMSDIVSQARNRDNTIYRLSFKETGEEMNTEFLTLKDFFKVRCPATS